MALRNKTAGRRYWRLRTKRSILCFLVAAGVAGCTVQLTAPYNEDIDQEASSLQTNFLRFVANLQMVAGTPQGYYSQHQQQYSDFEASLAIIRMRSEALPGGVPCGHAIEQGKKAARTLSGSMQGEVSTRLSQPGLANASCITILAIIAEDQMERLRSQHQRRCNPTAPPTLCTTLFSSPPIFNIVTNAQSDAPLVSAVSISLNELVGAERDIKPPSGS